MNPSDGVTSLREALALANNATAGNLNDGDADNDGNALDTITFDQTVFANGGVIRLTQGTLTVSSAVRIDGSTPAGEIVITGDKDGDDILVGGTNLTVASLSYTGARLTDNVRVLLFDSNSDGSSINRLTITGGYASSKGGAISADNTSLSVSDSTIAGNFAGTDGGGITAQNSILTVTGSRMSGNHAGSDGGGLYLDQGTAAVSGSTIDNNAAISDGGGLYAKNASLTVTDSTITSNQSRNDGGGLYLFSTGFSISGGSITNNRAERDGGGLYSFDANGTIQNSTFHGNQARSDGGGLLHGGGSLSISNSTISGNSAGGTGGGGTFDTGTFSTFDINNATIARNSAGFGGGIYNLSGPMRIAHTTITDNTARYGGGGLYHGGTRAEVKSSIIAGNKATNPFTDGNDVASAGVQNTAIISLGNNFVGDGKYGSATLFTDGQNNDIVGTTAVPLSLANVFDQVVTRDPDSVPNSGDEFQAGGLADNGGPVQTVALKASLTNPAIDAGGTPLTEQALGLDVDGDGTIEATPISVDARGFTRSVDIAGVANTTGPTDIGAFETQGTATKGPDIFEGTASADTQAPGDGNDLIVGSLG
ncbi:MAG: choice-of-anchor Q domain-containing protein, partial [Pseudomonadota bacterium]